MKNVPLGSVCEINPRRTERLSTESECSFIPMEYIDDELGIIIKKAVRKVKEVEKGYTFFQNRDILFAKITPCMENGKCAIANSLVNGIGFGSTEFHVLRAKEKIIPEWIYYYLRQESTRRNAELGMTGSAGQKRVPSRFLEDILIPLPSPSEQKRIASILEKADRLRRLHRYAPELSSTYLQAVFLEMFGSWDYPLYPLQELSKDERGAFVNGPFGSNLLTSELTLSGVPVIYIRDIASGVYKRVSSVCVTEQKAKELNVCKVFPGDVLVAKVGVPPGTAAIYPESQPMGIITQDVIRIRVNRSLVTPEYLSTFLNSHKGYHTLEPIIVEGTRARFGLTPYKELPIPVPPLTLQDDFANIVRRYDRLRAQQREAYHQAEHLFQTLLHQAFEGELEPKPALSPFTVEPDNAGDSHIIPNLPRFSV